MEGFDLGHLEVASMFLFGDVKYLHLLVLLMAVDIATGLTKAWHDGSLWSRKSLFGFARKMLVFAVIIIANVADQVLGLNGVVAGGALLFYIGNEGLSILENLGHLGVPVPKFLTDRFHLIENKGNDKVGFKEEVKEELVGSRVEEQLDVRKGEKEGDKDVGTN